MTEIKLFGKPVQIPDGVLQYYKVCSTVPAVIDRALESIDLLFDGILSSKYDFMWAPLSTPEQESNSGHYCLLGLLNISNGRGASGDVLFDLNFCLERAGYPRIEVGHKFVERMGIMRQIYSSMHDEIAGRCEEVKEMREHEAERAADKTSDSVLGGVFNTIQSVRKSSRAQSMVTSNNISIAEKMCFAGVEYDKFVQRMRELLKEWYGQLRGDLITHIDSCKIPGWGSPVEMQAVVAKIDASDDAWTEDLVLARVFARPYDINYAVRCMDHFGEPVWGLSLLADLFGLDWNKACSEYMHGMGKGIDNEDEDHLLERRKNVEAMSSRLNGVRCAKELLARIDERLAAIDLEMRTVGDIVCTTREEAARSRAEKTAVDAIVQGVKLFPVEAVDELIGKVESANFQTEYGKGVLERLRDHRKYMLTVCGVAYPTYDEAKAAYEEKCKSEGSLASFIMRQVACGSSKGGEAIRLARYWPGAMDPDSTLGKLKSGNVVGAVASAGQAVGQELKNAASLVQGKLSGFFRKK